MVIGGGGMIYKRKELYWHGVNDFMSAARYNNSLN